jgi:hypothetical protein
MPLWNAEGDFRMLASPQLLAAQQPKRAHSPPPIFDCAARQREPFGRRPSRQTARATEALALPPTLPQPTSACPRPVEGRGQGRYGHLGGGGGSAGGGGRLSGAG